MSERAEPDPFTPVRSLSGERNTNPRQTLNILEAGEVPRHFEKKPDTGKGPRNPPLTGAARPG